MSRAPVESICTLQKVDERVGSAGVNLVAEIVVFDINAGGNCLCDAAERRSAFSMLVDVSVAGTVGHTFVT